MKKEKYIAPTMKVVVIRTTRVSLLAGSTLGVTNDDYNDVDYEEIR